MRTLLLKCEFIDLTMPHKKQIISEVVMVNYKYFLARLTLTFYKNLRKERRFSHIFVFV